MKERGKGKIPAVMKREMNHNAQLERGRKKVKEDITQGLEISDKQ